MARITILEVEGSEDTVRAALQQVFGIFNGARTPAVELPDSPRAPLALTASVPAGSPAQPEPPGKPAAANTPRRHKTKSHGPAPEPIANHALQDRIRALLTKHPMQSGDLGKALGDVHISTVYYHLRQMRETGAIETRPDEDGYTKNFLL